MNPRAVRLLRGTLVTTVSVVLASTAHLVAGGAAPGLVGMTIAVIVGSALGLWMLGGARLRPLRTAIVIAGAQVVFHAVFSWGALDLAASSDPHAGHTALNPIDVSANVVHDHSAMLLAHVVSGVLTLILVLAEQRIVAGLFELSTRFLIRLRTVVVAVIPAPPALLPLGRNAERPRGRSSLPAPRRRGPPVLAPLG